MILVRRQFAAQLGGHDAFRRSDAQLPAVGRQLDAELAQLNAVKDACDPKGLLNPGKGVPTLKRCQEYRSL